MDQIRKWIQENDWKSIGIIAYYGYFAINVLVKAFGYDSSDQIYKFFMLSGIILLGIKFITTRYTLREVVIIALLLGAGMFIWVMTKKATLLFLFLTIIGMKDVQFGNGYGYS